jgi:hypothetical protein
MAKLIKLQKLFLKTHPEIKESWIQDVLANDPSLLGFGDIQLKDKERIQPRSGRLDLLFQHMETKRRYEVEVQLGRTDEAHIIRTIEYWDIERRRYPQYDHCAVIIAEDITSRFLNIISLFNGAIPLIAIQMTAYQVGSEVALTFTTVLDELSRGMVDEDEDILEITDRDYWLKRGSADTVKMLDNCLELINEFAPKFELKFNKFYVGPVKEGDSKLFVLFRPRKKDLNIEIRLPQSDDIQKIIDDASLDDMGYDINWRRYRIRIGKSDFKAKESAIKQLMQLAYENENG